MSRPGRPVWIDAVYEQATREIACPDCAAGPGEVCTDMGAHGPQPWRDGRPHLGRSIIVILRAHGLRSPW